MNYIKVELRRKNQSAGNPLIEKLPAESATFTKTLDSTFNHGSLTGVTPEPLGYQGELVRVQIGAEMDDWIVSEDTVELANRAELPADQRYLHHLSLIEPTVLLQQVVASALSFTVGNWTLGEALNRVLRVSPLRRFIASKGSDIYHINSLQKRYAIELSQDQSEKKLSPVDLQNGTLLEQLNLLADQIGCVVYVAELSDSRSTPSLLKLRYVGADVSAKKFDATHLVEYTNDGNIINRANRLTTFITNGIPNHAELSSVHPALCSSPRSEEINLSDDNLELVTEYPIYKLEHVYALVHAPDALGNDLAAVSNDGRGSDVIPPIARGTDLKINITSAFVTDQAYSTLGYEGKQSHYSWTQYSNRIPLTATSSTNPYFPQDKLKEVIRSCFCSTANSADADLVDYLSLELHKLGTFTNEWARCAYESTYRMAALGFHTGLEARVQIEYIPAVSGRFSVFNETWSETEVVQSQSEVLTDLEKFGKKQLQLLNRQTGRAYTARSVFDTPSTNRLAMVLNDRPTMVLDSLTTTFIQHYCEEVAEFHENVASSANFSGLSRVYREVLKPDSNVKRDLNLSITSKTTFDPDVRYFFHLSTFEAPDSFDDEAVRLSTPAQIFVKPVVLSDFGNTHAFTARICEGNSAGDYVEKKGSIEVKIPLPFLKTTCKRNFLQVKLYRVDPLEPVRIEDGIYPLKGGEPSYIRVADGTASKCTYRLSNSGDTTTRTFYFPPGLYAKTGLPGTGALSDIGLDYVYGYLGPENSRPVLSTGARDGKNYPKSSVADGLEAALATSFMIEVDKAYNESLTLTIQFAKS